MSLLLQIVIYAMDESGLPYERVINPLFSNVILLDTDNKSGSLWWLEVRGNMIQVLDMRNSKSLYYNFHACEIDQLIEYIAKNLSTAQR